MSQLKQFIAPILGKLALRSIRVGLNTLVLLSEEKAGALAFDLFCRPRNKNLTSDDINFLKTAEQKDLFFEGSNIRCYRWKGRSPGILLAHGWESSAARWQTLIQEMVDLGLEVIALDAPAHGQSGGKRFTVVDYASFLEKAIDHFQPQQLIAHSAGAMAAVYHLTHHEKASINRLALMGTPSELTDLMHTYQKTVKLSEAVIASVETLFRTRYGFSISDFSIKKFAIQLKLPGLVIHDKQDVIASYEGSVAIHENWKGSQFVGTSGLGHSLRSQAINDILLGFVKGEKIPGNGFH